MRRSSCPCWVRWPAFVASVRRFRFVAGWASPSRRCGRAGDAAGGRGRGVRRRAPRRAQRRQAAGSRRRPLGSGRPAPRRHRGDGDAGRGRPRRCPLCARDRRAWVLSRRRGRPGARVPRWPGPTARASPSSTSSPTAAPRPPACWPARPTCSPTARPCGRSRARRWWPPSRRRRSPRRPRPAPTDLVDLLIDAGLEIVVEGGMVRGEVNGLEVARIVHGDDDGRRADRRAPPRGGRGQGRPRADGHGPQRPARRRPARPRDRDRAGPPPPRARPGTRSTSSSPTGGCGRCCAATPASSGWPRCARPRAPARVRTWPSGTWRWRSARTTHGDAVVVACSVGIALDLVPTAADGRLADRRHRRRPRRHPAVAAVPRRARARRPPRHPPAGRPPAGPGDGRARPRRLARRRLTRPPSRGARRDPPDPRRWVPPSGG